MMTYEELRGGHRPRDIGAELRRIGGLGTTKTRQVKPRILLNPRTGRKTFEYPLEDGESLSVTLPSKARPSETV